MCRQTPDQGRASEPPFLSLLHPDMHPLPFPIPRPFSGAVRLTLVGPSMAFKGGPSFHPISEPVSNYDFISQIGSWFRDFPPPK